ncbi:MAG: DUF2490 domain-containing protein [Flavobacteriales bacterium]
MIYHEWMIKRMAIYVMVLFFNAKLYAQTEGLGSWNIFQIRYAVNTQWSFFAETQIRSLRLYNHFHYHEYKAGASRKLNEFLTVSLGAGDYDTYTEGGNFFSPKRNDEFRLWPQVVVIQTLGKLRIEQRFRYEARFSSADFRNRFRFRLGIQYPIGKKTETGHRHQLAVNNELFFSNVEPYFERNRFQAMWNYHLNKKLFIQLGYLYQFDYRLNDETGRDFLVVGWVFDLHHSNDTTTTEKYKVEDH